MHWSTALYKAVDAFDGGARSFPLASEADFARKYGAGWLIPDPDDASICKPVFVAYSTLGAIWLLRETLADDALSNNGWASPELEELVDKQRTITTVTNNNRRAERERIKAYKAALVERSLDLGLVAPDKQAADDERGAYAAILVKDKEVVAWLLKQKAIDRSRQEINFYCAFKTPYVKACQFALLTMSTPARPAWAVNTAVYWLASAVTLSDPFSTSLALPPATLASVVNTASNNVVFLGAMYGMEDGA
ncbi:hypothetical protein E8E11_000117 [Didymella keratinophila]|nr:hypothetical protein E8E11_000117 [Didymella keratinophila]